MSSRAGMARGAKVYVAGHRGLVGSALVRGLRAAGFDNLVTRAHAELDLGDAAAVRSGDLWIGDVGQNRFEEVDRATQASGGGGASTSAGGSWRAARASNPQTVGYCCKVTAYGYSILNTVINRLFRSPLPPGEG